MAARRLPEPIQVTSTISQLNKKVLGKVFKKDQKIIADFFEAADEQVKADLAARITDAETITISSEGKDFELTREMISFTTETKT